MKLDYDLIIATANRPDMLRASLPSLMCQTRSAKTLIIADASDDHEATAQAVHEVTTGAPFEVVVFHTSKGASVQRNAGLAYSTAPVIFFPDDDSIWYDDVGEQVMRIYERDTKAQIGGVGQVEAFVSPTQMSQQQNEARQTSLIQILKYRASLLRHRIVNSLMANPLHSCGLELLARHEVPSWLPDLNAKPIERQIGFRMSYRADAVRRNRFDEDLRLPRSLWEDFALSYAVLQDQLMVEAQDAKVFHYRFGGNRGNSLENGVEQLLNLCYIVCKYSPPGSAPRKALFSYARVFIGEAALFRAPLNSNERDKLRGLLRARREFNFLISSPLDELTQRYRQALARCLNETLPITTGQTSAPRRAAG